MTPPRPAKEARPEARGGRRGVARPRCCLVLATLLAFTAAGWLWTCLSKELAETRRSFDVYAIQMMLHEVERSGFDGFHRTQDFDDSHARIVDEGTGWRIHLPSGTELVLGNSLEPSP